MAASTTISITIDADAAERIDELGLRAEFQRILDHILQTIPDIASIHVKLSLPYDTGDAAAVMIEAKRTVPLAVPDDVWRTWSRWKVATLAPDVSRWFQMTTVHEG